MPVKQTLGGNPFFGSTKRATFIKVVIFIIAVVFIGRLGFLQIIKGSTYLSESESQALKQVIVEPFRGNMYDRAGELIVHNEPSFSIALTPNDFRLESIPLLLSIVPVDTLDIIKAISVKFSKREFRNRILPEIAEIIEIDTLNLDTDFRFKRSYSRFSPIKVYRDADISEISLIEEYGDYLAGINIIVESKRLYEFDGTMAHIMGYAREISRQELNRYQYYRPGDYIGKKGLEKSYENLLRGNKGIQFVAVNSSGKKISSFDGGRIDIKARNGFDLHLSIMTPLQEMAEKLLEGQRGSVVAIDPRNGEVLILAAKPDFDPRNFTGKVSPELYGKLLSDKGKPMFNRAIQSQYSPGSTWKMLVALAGLQEGIINENTTFYCRGSFPYGGRAPRCHGAHGAISVRRAIQASCNVFFYQLGLKLGMDNFEKYGLMFGFGEKSYIDIPNEYKGIMPTMEWLTASKRRGFSKGKLLNYGIGQGEITVTPLQMAVYCATIANGGTVYQPHIVRAVHNNLTNKTEPIPVVSKEVPIKPRYFDIIKNGMFDVVNRVGGTAQYARVDGIDVCGKTGTAQNPHGKDHAWFICFAPKDKPEIAMCVMVENSGYGGSVAAPISQKLMKAYFFPDSLDKKDIQIEETFFPDSLQAPITYLE